jgi:hypothetical protein
MPSKDISRHLFQPRKRYAGVRMQQGRVILDSDWNESEGIDDEDARRALVDIIGPRGTSNDGFRIRDVTYNGGPSYDFTFDAGSYYVGGLRVDADDEGTFLGQDDWVRIEADPARLPRWPEVDELQDQDGVRNDLVYLHVWEQPVSAVEDSELVERALGGPDTSVRMRRMRRVEVLPSLSSTDCTGGFAELADQVAGSIAPAGVDEATGEVIGTARLRIDALPDGVPDDPCRPAVRGGFLGAENETLRVELVGPDRFIWGRDNAAPLYRVVLEQVGGAWSRIRFLTRPRDQAAFPLKGQAVEILPWGAVLPSREKVSELQGHLSRVAVTYTPDAGGDYIDLETPVPAAYQAWMDEHGSRFESERDGEHPQYFFLRVWTGANPAADGPTTRFDPGVPVALGQTGLQATFSHRGLPGQFWIAAARPHTPDQVVPWDLAEGAPPAGTRHFYAPLALIRWTTDGESVYSEVEDCRDWFPPLTRVRGCCTITVGDGLHSRGHVRTIAEALARLPREGGTICLLPGVYRERIRLAGRSNVTIEGCGKRSVVTNPPGEAGYAGNGLEPTPPALVEIAGGSDLILRSFRIEAIGLPGIKTTPPEVPTKNRAIRGLTIEAMEIVQKGRPGETPGMPLGAIDIEDAEDVTIRDSLVYTSVPHGSVGRGNTLASNGPWPTIYAEANRLRIVGNRISHEGEERRQTWGGLQLGSGDDIVIERNVIEGGFGHGITLGSLVYEWIESPISPPVEQYWLRIPIGITHTQGTRLHLTPGPVVIGDKVFHDSDSDSLLWRLHLRNNRIENGGSGIAAVTFDEATTWASVTRVLDSTIDDNDVVDYGEHEVTAQHRLAAPMFGGIVLSVVERLQIRNNRLASRISGRPLTGIGAVSAVNLAIENNTVRHDLGADEAEIAGPRAGIFVQRAEHSEGGWSAKIHGNQVVQWRGSALRAHTTLGELDVQDNFFESHGLSDYEIGNSMIFALGASWCRLHGAAVDLRSSGYSVERNGSAYSSAPIRFHGNDVRLLWHNARADVASALILAYHDEVWVTDNRFTLDTDNGVTFGESVEEFVLKVHDAASGIFDRSFLTFHVVVLGETFHVSTNRFAEGRHHAASSLLAASHWDSDSDAFGMTAAMNHASHCIYTVPDSGVVRTGNQVRHPVRHGCSYYADEYVIRLDVQEATRTSSSVAIDRTVLPREQVAQLRAWRASVVADGLRDQDPASVAARKKRLGSIDGSIQALETRIATLVAAPAGGDVVPVPTKPGPGNEPTGGGNPPAES